MATQKANINPDILAWARKEAGLSLAEAAGLAKISATKKKTAAQRLEEWEEKSKDNKPTQNQLAAIAKAYYRPVLTFYLPNRPVPNTDVADFRTLGDGGVGTLSPKLRALVSKVKARQQEMLELIRDENEEPQPLPFVGRYQSSRDVKLVAKDIEQELNLPLNRRVKLNDNDALFRLIRNSAEDRGIFVLAQGDLGSYHTDIAPSVFRGFTLADPLAPFIVLNDNDAKAAQTFTLIHELAHLWIGDTGISNFNPFNEEKGGSLVDERFCNAVSAEFLMPKEAIAEIWQLHEALDLPEAIRTIAMQFGVSRAAVGHRLWRLGEIDGDRWWPLFRSYQDDWEAKKKKVSNEADNKSPPIYYPIKVRQLGRRLIRTVLAAVDAGEMSYTRASRVLGVAPNGFEKLRSRVA